MCGCGLKHPTVAKSKKSKADHLTKTSSDMGKDWSNRGGDKKRRPQNGKEKDRRYEDAREYESLGMPMNKARYLAGQMKK